MKPIPTAEEFARKYKDDQSQYKSLTEYFQDFAKLHVQAALEAAHKNQQLPMEDLEFTLNAYPLENIK